jgi:hypothetical protein
MRNDHNHETRPERTWIPLIIPSSHTHTYGGEHSSIVLQIPQHLIQSQHELLACRRLPDVVHITLLKGDLTTRGLRGVTRAFGTITLANFRLWVGGREITRTLTLIDSTSNRFTHTFLRRILKQRSGNRWCQPSRRLSNHRRLSTC